MRRLMGSIGVLVLVFGLSAGSIATESGVATVDCVRGKHGSTKCHLKWDMTSNPGVYHRVQRLNGNDLDWENYTAKSTRARKGKVRVGEASLYRVVGCDDQELTKNCVSSTAAWANTLRPVEEIPEQFEIVDVDGSVVMVGVVKNSSSYVQLSQYNVYLMSDLVNRVALQNPDALPEMLVPVEPDGDMTLDHQIKHNVQSNYEGPRKSREAKLKRQE